MAELEMQLDIGAQNVALRERQISELESKLLHAEQQLNISAEQNTLQASRISQLEQQLTDVEAKECETCRCHLLRIAALEQTVTDHKFDLEQTRGLLGDERRVVNLTEELEALRSEYGGQRQVLELRINDLTSELESHRANVVHDGRLAVLTEELEALRSEHVAQLQVHELRVQEFTAELDTHRATKDRILQERDMHAGRVKEVEALLRAGEDSASRERIRELEQQLSDPNVRMAAIGSMNSTGAHSGAITTNGVDAPGGAAVELLSGEVLASAG